MRKFVGVSSDTISSYEKFLGVTVPSVSSIIGATKFLLAEAVMYRVVHSVV